MKVRVFGLVILTSFFLAPVAGSSNPNRENRWQVTGSGSSGNEREISRRVDGTQSNSLRARHRTRGSETHGYSLSDPESIRPLAVLLLRERNPRARLDHTLQVAFVAALLPEVVRGAIRGLRELQECGLLQASTFQVETRDDDLVAGGKVEIVTWGENPGVWISEMRCVVGDEDRVLGGSIFLPFGESSSEVSMDFIREKSCHEISLAALLLLVFIYDYLPRIVKEAYSARSGRDTTEGEQTR